MVGGVEDSSGLCAVLWPMTFDPSYHPTEGASEPDKNGLDPALLICREAAGGGNFIIALYECAVLRVGGVRVRLL